MSGTSDHAELVTLRSSLEELTQRAVTLGDTYRNTDSSGIAADLETAERALISARRAFDRAIKSLAPAPDPGATRHSGVAEADSPSAADARGWEWSEVVVEDRWG